MKEKYIFHTSWMNAIEKLSAEYQLLAIKMIHRYAAEGIEPTIPGQGDPGYYMAWGIYVSAKQTIDDNNAKAAARSASARAAGQASAAARAQAAAPTQSTAPSAVPPKADDLPFMPAPTYTQTSTGPTLEEVRAYWAQMGWNGDPDKFHSYYGGKGWTIEDKATHTKNPIKYWKSVAKKWAEHEKSWGKPKTQETPVDLYRQPTGRQEMTALQDSLTEDDSYAGDVVMDLSTYDDYATAQEKTDRPAEVIYLNPDSDDLPF